MIRNFVKVSSRMIDQKVLMNKTLNWVHVEVGKVEN